MNSSIRKLALSAMFLAIGQVLPFITGQIPAIGAVLSPMHYPVFLCGFVCGPLYAGVVGLICPIMRSLLFGMPAMFPNAVTMAFELCAYGLIVGVMYRLLQNAGIIGVYVTLITAMIGGRLIWGMVQRIITGPAFTMEVFIARGFTNAALGIAIQLVLIPVIVMALKKSGQID